MDFDFLTGRQHDQLHRIQEDREIFLHVKACAAYLALADDARKNGIRISIASGHRSFDKQKAIWNAKASGQRKVLDRNENELNYEKASKDELLKAMLTWSAIPGASRHHWGTDFDIFDQSIKSANELRLTQDEYKNDFSKLCDWLDSELERFPFHRPYLKDCGGIACEPWHLSYTPLSSQFEESYTYNIFEKNLLESDFLLKELLLEETRDFFERLVQVSN